MTLNRLFLLAGYLWIAGTLQAQLADKQTYLNDFKKEMTLEWPDNRTLNTDIVYLQDMPVLLW